MINFDSSFKKIQKSYSKNIPEVRALLKNQYPNFVYKSNIKTLKDEIPVFTIHTVEPSKFEEQLFFLRNNGYKTLNADEFYECVKGIKPINERSIVLTFDDGWKNVYTHVYPMLNNYGMKAVCFIIPGLISEMPINNNEGESKDERGPNADILCSWNEIREMHQSGVIDFQSHSMYHELVFVSSNIEDFFYPSFDSFAMNFNIPMFKINGKENIYRGINLGTPIYKYASRFLGKKRYLDDENLRNECIQYVRLNGEEEFFRRNNWRKKLFSLVKKYKMKYGESGHFEDEEVQRKNLFRELYESKHIIEKNLPGKIVSHFCYPWWQGSNLAVEISKEAGYLTNFWGPLQRRRTNHLGDDPLRIARLLSDDYIFRLPGEGRKSLLKIIKERISNNYNRFTRTLTQTDFQRHFI